MNLWCFWMFIILPCDLQMFCVSMFWQNLNWGNRYGKTGYGWWIQWVQKALSLEGQNNRSLQRLFSTVQEVSFQHQEVHGHFFSLSVPLTLRQSSARNPHSLPQREVSSQSEGQKCTGGGCFAFLGDLTWEWVGPVLWKNKLVWGGNTM